MFKQKSEKWKKKLAQHIDFNNIKISQQTDEKVVANYEWQ